MTEAEREREAIVKWLRREHDWVRGFLLPVKNASEIADAIENGEHLPTGDR